MVRSCIRPAAVLLAALCALLPACAGTLVVTRLDDTNDGICDEDCSLREAIAAAGSLDTITFANDVTGTSTLTLGDLVIDKKVTIAGPGRDTLAISGGDTQRIFTITTSGDLTASGLTFTRGQSAYYAPQIDRAGGAVLASGAFDFTDCTFSDNHSDGMTGSVNNTGGVIYADAYYRPLRATRCIFENNSAGGGACMDVDGGALTITDSTFRYNSTSLGPTAGVICNSNEPAVITGSVFYANRSRTGGVVWVSGNGGAIVTNSTFAFNTAVVNGGAFLVKSPLVLNNVTASGNSAATGKTLYVAAGGSAIVGNTIFDARGPNCGGVGTVSSTGYNLESDDACGFDGPGDLVGTPANLGALGDHGGPTKTMALTPCSPAIDAASDTTCPETDQRGIARPQGSHCDIGAFEWVQGPPLTVSFCTDRKSLGWGTQTGAESYDIAFGRTAIPGAVFDGDFSGFREPADRPGCAPSCDLEDRVYDTSCTGNPGTGIVEMWVVRAGESADATWNGPWNQVGTRDDSDEAPNPRGIPHELVCP